MSDELIPPHAARLREVLSHLGIAQAELARRAGYSQKHVNGVARGAARITPEFAVRVQATLGAKGLARELLELQARYELGEDQRDELESTDL